MKCRPGDLAIVVRSDAGNDGRIVTCVRVATAADWSGEFTLQPLKGTYWVLDRPLTCRFEIRYADRSVERIVRPTYLYPDAKLLPIRDPGDDAVDEILLRVGAPEAEAA